MSDHHLPSPSSRPSELLNCFQGEDEDSQTEFSYETDHAALTGNSDYLALMNALAALQAQRTQAIQDIDALRDAEAAALRDPLELVRKLQSGRSIFAKLPEAQKVVPVPDIEWEKYSKIPSMTNKIQTRKNEKNEQGKSTSAPSSNFVIRGRVFDDSKPKTFNQHWTPEEQRRLEELLIQFPSEEVEMERWKKIAAALGNRTCVQVQSRTQKYFLKLQRAGLPIPGKLTKSKSKYQGGGGKSNRNKIGTVYNGQKRASTFFHSLNPTVKMSDEDENDQNVLQIKTEENPTSGMRIRNDGYYVEDEDVSDEEELSEVSKSSPVYQELMWLKRIRKEVEFEQSQGRPVIHAGFRCDGCNVEPIVGGRFQCVDRGCLDTDTVDFCLKCAPKGLEIGAHKKSHSLRPVRRKAAAADEYKPNQNYLDPNFMNE